MRIIFLSLFFIYTLPLLSQDFVMRSYSQIDELLAKDFIVNPNGDYLVIGSTTQDHGFLAKYDSLGELIHVHYALPSALSSYNQLYQIKKYSDSTFIVGGKIAIDVGPTSIWHSIVACIDSNSNTVWSNVNSLNSNTDVALKDIEILSNGNIAVLSTIISGNQSILEVMDENGNSLWSKIYSLPFTSFSLNDILQDSESNLWACGTYQNLGAYSGIIMKMDSLGTLIWSQKYEDINQPEFLQIIQMDDSFILANQGHAWDQIDLIKIDSAGNMLQQFNLPSQMAIVDGEAIKPLQKIDSTHYWYWRGDPFGSNAFSMTEDGLINTAESFYHWGDLQSLIQDENGITILSSGPMYGVKNQTLFQKHFSLCHTESVLGLFNYCSNPNGENPTNNITILNNPIAVQTDPNTLAFSVFIGFSIQNEWIQEPLCVEFLGGVEELGIVVSPNPCDTYLHVNGFVDFEFTIFDLYGRRMLNGIISSNETIDVSTITTGNFLLKIGENTTRIHIQH